MSGCLRLTTNARDGNKKRVLFLCTHNSVRSQMAEGLLRAMHGDRFEAYSAGVVATSVDPCAVRVMGEIGIDISCQRSKTVQEFQGLVFDLAVTVCDHAKQACPIVSTDLDRPGGSPKAHLIIHHSFADPASVTGSEEERLKAYRRARDEICEWISEALPKVLSGDPKDADRSEEQVQAGLSA